MICTIKNTRRISYELCLLSYGFHEDGLHAVTDAIPDVHPPFEEALVAFSGVGF